MFFFFEGRNDMFEMQMKNEKKNRHEGEQDKHDSSKWC